MKNFDFSIPPWKHNRNILKTCYNIFSQCKKLSISLSPLKIQYLKIGQTLNVNLLKYTKMIKDIESDIISKRVKQFYKNKHNSWWKLNKKNI